MSIQRKIIITIAVFLVLDALSVIFIVMPLMKEIDRNSEEIVNQKKNLVALEAEIENLGQFRSIYQELEDILKETDKLFVNADLPIEFVTFLEDRARESGLSIEISPVGSAADKKDLWPSFLSRITIDGFFPKLLGFVEKIENAPYLIEIQNLNLKETGTGQAKEVRGVMTIKAYTK